mgnify:CR=1 FL=1
MRVLFLTDSLSDLDGVGRYAVRLIRSLQEQRPGLEARILLARKHRPTSRDVPPQWDVRVALPPDYFFHMSAPKFWASLASSSWRVFAAARGCDLVHAIKDYPHSLSGLIGARMAGVPCIATGHGTYTVQPLVDPRHAARARWCYSRFAALIAVSRFTARRVTELVGESDEIAQRLRVIPNAVDAGHFARRLDIGAKPWHAHPFTLAIGELKERKGHHVSLAAWLRCAATRPQLHHYVVGKGSDDEHHRSLLELVRRSGLEARVHFLGNIDEDEKIDLLQRAQVFVHTPVRASDGGFEGFGLVYLEASAAGTACLGTLGCGAEDAIVHERTGLLVEPDVDAVAAGLARMLDSESLRARLGAAGRAHAAASSWSDNARAVLELYDAALAGRRGA